jgi:hypothetical protein
MVRPPPQDPAIKTLRLLQASGLVVPDGEGKRCVRVRRRRACGAPQRPGLLPGLPAPLLTVHAALGSCPRWPISMEHPGPNGWERRQWRQWKQRSQTCAPRHGPLAGFSRVALSAPGTVAETGVCRYRRRPPDRDPAPRPPVHPLPATSPHAPGLLAGVRGANRDVMWAIRGQILP